MKKLINLLVITSFLLLLVPSAAFADGETVVDLLAGQHIQVGSVTVSDNGTTLSVTYEITNPGWCMTETHLYVDAKEPKKAAPGRFPYKHEGLDCVQSDVYTISLGELGVSSGDELYIAAHAVVYEIVDYTVDQAALAASPSGTVTMEVAFPGGDSYFNTTVSGLGLDGTYDGWCVDTSRHISSQPYEATVTSSYDPAAAALVDRPENLDLVNYVINHTDYYYGLGYDWRDVQRAIWELIEYTQSDANIEGFHQEHVDAIVADALINGEGFVPGCGGVMAVILNPIKDGDTVAQITIAQITLIEYGVPCDPILGGDETAWAEGESFKGKGNGWAMYFGYTVE